MYQESPLSLMCLICMISMNWSSTPFHVEHLKPKYFFFCFSITKTRAVMIQIFLKKHRNRLGILHVSAIAFNFDMFDLYDPHKLVVYSIPCGASSAEILFYQ